MKYVIALLLTMWMGVALGQSELVPQADRLDFDNMTEEQKEEAAIRFLTNTTPNPVPIRMWVMKVEGEFLICVTPLNVESGNCFRAENIAWGLSEAIKIDEYIQENELEVVLEDEPPVEDDSI